MKKRAGCLVTNGQKSKTLFTRTPDVNKIFGEQRKSIIKSGIYEEYYDLYVKDDFANEIWDRDEGIVILTSYNIIKAEDIVKPNYPLHDRSRISRSLYIYFNHSDEIIIINESDNNYISWVSVNLMSEYDLNKFIIKHLINQTDEFMFNNSASAYSDIWSRTNIVKSKFNLLNTHCCLCLKWEKVEDAEGLKSNMGKFYSGSLNEMAGEIARDIIEIPKEFREKCAETENDEFTKWLNNYRELLSKCKEGYFDIDYCENINIYEMDMKLRKNQYHLLSENEKIRQIYSEVMQKCHSMYLSCCNYYR